MRSHVRRSTSVATFALALAAVWAGGSGASGASGGADRFTTGDRGYYIAVNGNPDLVPVTTNPRFQRGFFRAMSSTVIDRSGGRHVLTAVHGRLRYLTDLSGHGHWTRHLVQKKYNGLGPHVVPLLSQDGQRVMYFFGRHVGQTSVRSLDLPRPRAAPITGCFAGNASDHNAAVIAAVARPHQQVTMLLRDAHGQVCSGQLGSLKPVRLPASKGITINWISRDASRGTITVVGSGNTAHSGIFAWTSSDGLDWSPRQTVANRPTTYRRHDGSSRPSRWSVTSITAARGVTWIALQDYAPATGQGASVHYFLLHSEPGSNWSRLQPVPHVHAVPLLIANQETGALHVIYNRYDTQAPRSGSGIAQIYFKNGSWSSPRFLTHWIGDGIGDISLTAAGHPIVSFQRLNY